MGKVKCATGIDYVSGSLSKPKVRDGHSCGTYLTGTHRVAATENPNCNRVYIRKPVKRTTPVTARELEIRTRFQAVAAAVVARSKDLMNISTDQAAFLAQKDQPNGKKTMRAYLWKVCGDAWDAQHGN